MTNKTITIAIPAFNEEQNIVGVLQSLIERTPLYCAAAFEKPVPAVFQKA